MYVRNSGIYIYICPWQKKVNQPWAMLFDSRMLRTRILYLLLLFRGEDCNTLSLCINCLVKIINSSDICNRI